MDSEPTWSGESVVATVLSALSDDDTLVLGASNSIRDADLAPIRPSNPRVYSNRGLSGIDGFIATACGIATGLEKPVTAIMGDLTALHDISSLAKPVLERGVDLRFVCVDDHGGSLFSSLEYGAPRAQIGELADWFERLFAVPMEVDLGAVICGFGVPVLAVTSVPELSKAISSPRSGIDVIHVQVPRLTRAQRDQALAKWGLEAVRSTVDFGE
jgi:2-succinyl-5-enolpyruvyl-6-hydroxy-3-cyclohexene-1-carboxylate synthase